MSKRITQLTEEELRKRRQLGLAGQVVGKTKDEKKAWTITSDRTPEPGSTVLYGRGKDVKEMTAEEYAKLKNKPNKKKKKGFFRSLSRLIKRD